MPKIYQVFIGCPFAKEVRKSYDKLKKDLEASTPLSIVLADTIGVTSSDYLLEHITELITDSAGCVFDATGANPNVSLEVGIAHTVPTDFILTLKTRKPRTGSTTTAEVRSIISDLQGKPRVEYKTYNTLRDDVEDRFLFFPRKKLAVHFGGYVLEVLGQGPRHAGKIGVVAEHDLFVHREVELRGVAAMAEEHVKRVEGLLADLLLPQEMVAPRLVAQVDHQLKIRRVADPADHSNHLMLLRMKSLA